MFPWSSTNIYGGILDNDVNDRPYIMFPWSSTLVYPAIGVKDVNDRPYRKTSRSSNLVYYTNGGTEHNVCSSRLLCLGIAGKDVNNRLGNLPDFKVE